MRRYNFMLRILLICLLSAMYLPAFNAAEAVEQTDQNQPTTEHEALSKYNGDWKASVRMGSSNKAIEFTGTAEAEMILDGRFLQISVAAKNGESSAEARYILGFDRRHSKYQVALMDGWGTYFVTATGSMLEDGSIKLYGKDDDPHMKKLGLGEKEFAIQFRFADDKQFTIEIFYIDTRTEERRELSGMVYSFERG